MNIVLIGFMGTGKSAIGRALAKRIGARYVDTDAEIEKESGKRVAEIFAEQGEPAFRRMETMLLMRLINDLGSMVVATGGGTPLRDDNVSLLKKIGPVVWLTAPTQTILGRVRRNLERRPMLSDHAHDPVARIQQLLKERTPRYAAVQDYEFDTSNFDKPEDAVVCILAMLGHTKDSWATHPSGAPRAAPVKKTMRLGLRRD